MLLKRALVVLGVALIAGAACFGAVTSPVVHHSTPGSTVPPATAAEDGLPFGYHQPYVAGSVEGYAAGADASIISINDYSFDTRQGDPVLPARLAITGYKGGSGYYLVQYPGPVTDAVRASLAASGAVIMDYIPNNAFLVRLTSAAHAALAAKGGVSYLGLFQPAYKLAAAVAAAKGRRDVNIILFRGENTRETIEQLKDLGAEVVASGSSQWCSIIHCSADAALLPAIARLPQVRFIEPFLQMHQLNNVAQYVGQDNIANVRRIWYANGTDNTGGIRLLGQGQVTGHSDSGVDMNHYAFRDPAVPVTTFGQYPTHRKMIAYIQGSDKATYGDVGGHGTHTCGTICGNDSGGGAATRSQYCGMAPYAKHWFVDIGGTSSTNVYPPSIYAEMWQPAYNGNAGGACRIFSQSWGGDDTGHYYSDDQMVDQFMWDHKDFIIFIANGNAGPTAGSVGSPANAKNTVSVGATLGAVNGAVVSYSSRGPTQDGRYKPTVCAPGDGASEYSGMMSASNGTTDSYIGMQGTSMAAPDAAGQCALVRQYFTEGWYPTGTKNPANAFIPSAALLKAALVCSGDSTPAYLNNNYGFGRINLWSVLYVTGATTSNPLWLADEQDGISTGQARSYRIPVVAGADLKVALVWNDYPGAINTTPELVNNLDLLVTDPSGSNQYKGNVFASGQSATGGNYDTRNVEEVVRRKSPAAGTWTVTVSGTNCPMGPQPYALVVTGNLNVSAQPQIIASAVAVPTSPTGTLRPGSVDSLIVTLKNVGVADAVSAAGVLRCRTAQATVLDSTADLGTIAANGGTATGRFRVQAAAGLNCWTQIPFDVNWAAAADTGNAGFQATANQPDTGSQFVVWGYGDNNDYINWMTALSQRGYKGRWLPDKQLPAYLRPAPLVIFALMSGLSGTNTSDYPVADSFKLGLTNDSLLYKFLNTTYDSGGLYVQAPEYGFGHVDASGPKYGKVILAKLGATYTAAMDLEARITGVSGAAGTPFSSFTFSYNPADTGSNGGSCDIDGIKKTGTGIDYMRFVSTRNDTALVGNIGTSPAYRSLVATFLLHGLTDNGGQTKAAYVDTVMHWFGIHAPLGVAGEPTYPEPPHGSAMDHNRPNPFVSSTAIAYQLAAPTAVTLRIYNVAGQVVRTLVNGTQQPGRYNINWNGTDDNGQRLAAGVYIYSLDTGNSQITRKMTLVK